MASARLMPIALTLMRTWFGPGAGTWTSTNSRTSGPPAFAKLIERDMAVSVRRFRAKPDKQIVDRQAAIRVHGRRLSWLLGWHRSVDRSVLGCVLRASAGVAERRRAGGLMALSRRTRRAVIALRPVQSFRRR